VWKNRLSKPEKQTFKESVTQCVIKSGWYSFVSTHWTVLKGYLLIASGSVKRRALKDCAGHSSLHSTCNPKTPNKCLLARKPVFPPSFLTVNFENHFLSAVCALSHACTIQGNQDKRGQLLSGLRTGWLVPEAHCKTTLSEKGQEQSIFSYKIKKSLGLCDRLLFSEFGNSSVQLKITVKKRKKNQ